MRVAPSQRALPIGEHESSCTVIHCNIVLLLVPVAGLYRRETSRNWWFRDLAAASALVSCAFSWLGAASWPRASPTAVGRTSVPTAQDGLWLQNLSRWNTKRPEPGRSRVALAEIWEAAGAFCCPLSSCAPDIHSSDQSSCPGFLTAVAFRNREIEIKQGCWFYLWFYRIEVNLLLLFVLQK